ncbi:MAG: hypothetical protein U9O24_06320 [Campylobacterota bacterium]|nr:hypothetical protein [Campylobacterota bacterium]
MIKISIISLLLLLINLNAEDRKKLYPGLSAYVVKVAQNDVLNVRDEPNKRAKTVGSWSNEAWLIIDHCVKVKKSTWCKADLDPLTGDGALGWVNAYYLKFINDGFVIQKDGKGESCTNASKCEKRKDRMQCYLFDGYYLNEKFEISTKGKWIDRSLLKGGTMLTAAKDTEMCGNLPYPMQQSDAKKLKILYTKDESKAYKTVLEYLRIVGQPYFIDNPLVELEKLIHPTKGVTVTDMVRFGDKNEQHYDAKSFLKSLNEDKKILWGKTYAKGEPINKSLKEWVNDAHREMSTISKIEPLKAFKGFPTAGYSGLKAYEVYWINEESKSSRYDWLGLVVLVAENQGKWYVVGLMRDRWTI